MNKGFLKSTFLLGFVLMLVTDSYSQPGGHYTKMEPRRPGSVSNMRRPPSPGSGAVWIDEDWKWNNGGYAWGGGYWARPPYGGAVWVPGRWVRSRYGWQWTPGRWVRRGGHRPPNRPRY